MRHLSSADRLCLGIDTALRTIFGAAPTTDRPDPAQTFDETDLSDSERRHIAGLMRVNHTGEVCAQALYQGQAVTARLEQVRDKMEQAAIEENDHLAWCDTRLRQLDSRTSLLNPFWYGGSFAIGALAGLAGDRWSLGFVAETEDQVVRHLDDHLQQLPEGDQKSRAVLETMRDDEARHATAALEAGGAPLPAPIRGLMGLMSKVMTKTAYHI